MSIWHQVKGFVRAFMSHQAPPPGDTSINSMAKTIKDSTDIRSLKGGISKAAGTQRERLVSEGHENYTNSFKKKKD